MTVIRALAPSEYRHFQLARMAAIEATPYFAHALFAMSPVAAEGLGTFAVDRAWRLYMDPALLREDSEWSVVQAGAVLIHEVNHLLRDHAPRADAVETRVDRVRWNYAADAEINDDLVAAGLALPEGVVVPEALGLPSGEVAETYYRLLAADRDCCEHAPDPGDSDAVGCGSGSGDASPAWELPRDEQVDGSAGLPRCEADLVRKQTARAVAAAGRGTVPAGLQRWAQHALAPPQAPWNKVLSATVRRVVSLRAGNVTRSYTRLSRRSQPEVPLPAWRAPELTVDVIIDTSGSMGQGALAAALTEVRGVLKAVSVSAVRFACCDAASTVLRPVRSVKDIVLTGGGGTDMRVGIAAALAQAPRSSVVVVLTDGDTPWPSRPIGVPLVVVLIGAGQHQHDRVPSWARSVMVPEMAATS